MGDFAGRCEITGVVRQDGRPIAARVEVRLLRTPEEEALRARYGRTSFGDAARSRIPHRTEAPVAIVVTDADGRYVVRGLAPASYAIRATTPDGAAVGRSLAVLTCDGERGEENVDVVAARERFRGRVVRADGSPWTGEVLVFPTSDGLAEPADGAAAATDAEGRFVVTGLPARPVEVLVVTGDGTQTLCGPVRLPLDDEFVVVIGAGTREIRGRVVAAETGEPIEGADVVGTASWPIEYGTRHRALTDAAGRFVVRVSSQRGRLSVRAAGFADADVAPNDPGQEVQIRLARGARVRGRLTSGPAGTPVPGARVLLVGRSVEDAGNRSSDRRTVTDGDGRYAFEGLAARAYAIVARGAGLVSSNYLPAAATSASGFVTVSAGDDRVVDLGMVPGGRVVGTVSDSDGNPVRGARVHAFPHFVYRPRPHDDPLPWAACAHGEDVTATAGDGSFSLDALVPDLEIDVSVRAAGAPASRASRVTPTAGIDARVDVRLPPPRWVDVTVVDRESGAPVASAFVTVAAFDALPSGDDDLGSVGIDTHSSSSTDQASDTTDAGGRARVGPLGLGVLHVRADAEGFVRGAKGEVIAGSERATSTSSATLRLERGRSISGRVQWPDGSPAADAAVTLQTPAGLLGLAVTDARGAFTFHDVGGGAHTIEAVLRRDGEHSAKCSVEAGAGEVALTLAKGPGPHRVVAHVLDAGGAPVPAARAFLKTTDGTFHGRVEGGRVEFDVSRTRRVPPTEGSLEIQMATDDHGLALPVGGSRLDGVHPGDEVEVRLAPERAVEGRVVGPDGRGVAGARVRADVVQPFDLEGRMSREPWMWSREGTTRTDEEGAFRIGQLTEGPHWIVTLPPPAYAVPDAVRTEAGDRGVLIRVKPAAVATLTVRDADGRPVAGARAVAATPDPEGDAYTMANLFTPFASGAEASADADGVVRLEGLDPTSRYVLGVRGPSSRADVAECVKRRWAPADRTIRLGRGRCVAGMVVDAEGRPVAQAHVQCGRVSGVNTSCTTGASGTFRFDGLGSGKVRLEALVYSLERQEVTSRAVARVAAGAEGVVLVLR